MVGAVGPSELQEENVARLLILQTLVCINLLFFQLNPGCQVLNAILAF
jgi:hypothetical protein